MQLILVMAWKQPLTMQRIPLNVSSASPPVTLRVQMLTCFVIKVDVGKTCKLAKRRRGLLFARNPPCFTTAQFPEVGKYNDAYNKVQKQSDVFIRKQIEWTTSEALHRFEAVDERNVVRSRQYLIVESSDSMVYLVVMPYPG